MYPDKYRVSYQWYDTIYRIVSLIRYPALKITVPYCVLSLHTRQELLNTRLCAVTPCWCLLYAWFPQFVDNKCLVCTDSCPMGLGGQLMCNVVLSTVYCELPRGGAAFSYSFTYIITAVLFTLIAFARDLYIFSLWLYSFLINGLHGCSEPCRWIGFKI